MKYVSFFIITLLLINPLSAQTDSIAEVTTYYFIRHAEKDRSDQSNKDPQLTETGKKRADRWSDVFKNINFDAIYASDYNRTRETAEPIVVTNELEISIYNPEDINLDKFLTDTKGKTILVVGHSDTTPSIVNEIIGRDKYLDIDDNNNGNLYIVTIINGKVTDQVLLIN